MRAILAASLILSCSCAHALDDTPTQNIYMAPHAVELRAPARERGDVPAPGPARRLAGGAEDGKDRAADGKGAVHAGPRGLVPANGQRWTRTVLADIMGKKAP